MRARRRLSLLVLTIAVGACASAPADLAAQRTAAPQTASQSTAAAGAQQTPARPPQTPPPPSTVAPPDPGTTTATRGPTAPPAVTPPAEKGAVLFAVIGDTGTGTQSQFDIGKQMTSARATFPFEFVIMVGDNIYGSERPQD